jgi:hypothetical protein
VSDISQPPGQRPTRRPITSKIDPRQDTSDHHRIELDVSNLNTDERHRLAETLRQVADEDSFVRSYISIDSAKLNAEQRQALNARLRSVAQGVALGGGLGMVLGAEGGHVSHNDSDGWI